MTSQTDLFAGGGAVRALARETDWSSTPLGPVETWPRTLRDVVRMCLDSPFPMNLWCGDELVLIYNDAYVQVLGDKHPAALGRRGEEVWSEIWTSIEPMFERIRGGGEPIFEEDAPFLVRRGADGEPLGPDPSDDPNAWFTFSLSPVRDEAGEIVAALNIVSESTRRLQAERAHAEARQEAERAEGRLRDVFSQAPAFMAVLRGRDYVFEYVNSAYYQLVGHRDLLGRPVFEALPEIRGQGFDELLDQVLETGEPFVGREVPFTVTRTPDSLPEERFVDLVYYPITEADGTRSGVVAHGSDVTEHVVAQREAQRARAEAEQANQAKSQFLATMSHEIRTPINAVVGYADLLDAGISGDLTDKQQSYVDGIRGSSKHLHGLVSDILDLAKIEGGEMVVGTAELPLGEEVHAAISIIAPQATDKGLELTEEWACGEDLRVRGDRSRIRQILLNLLSNALKFTDEGGRITVRCRTPHAAPPETGLPASERWVVVEVEDTGRGIPQDQIDRVFQPFVQGESGHTRRAGGTGLGLTISRRLARLMAGELSVQSEVDAGSCFSLWLPLAGSTERPGSIREELQTDHWPPRPEEVPGLAAAARTLLSHVDDAEREWVKRLEQEPRMGTAEQVGEAQIADQTAELIAAIGKTLFILEEGGGESGLLRDAEAIQSLVARRHGQQRRRLGWARSELEREYRILGDVLEETLRREAPRRSAANVTTANHVIRRLVQRAAGVSLSAFDGLQD